MGGGSGERSPPSSPAQRARGTMRSMAEGVRAPLLREAGKVAEGRMGCGKQDGYGEGSR